MFKFFRKKKKKVVIIGLDGTPFTLLDTYVKKGLMPGLGSLVSKGSLIRMETSIPEVSSVAWASFMTGKNPGEHGIFGFMELKPDSYEMYFPNFTHVKTETFWERAHVPSIVLNIPQTYPARPLNGIMTSGFVALDLKKATYPEQAYRYLNSIGYKIDVDAGLFIKNKDEFFNDFHDTFNKRQKAIRHFFENEKWEIFIGTVTETDRLHHFLYDQAFSPGDNHDQFTRFYRSLDSFISEMYERAQEEGALFLMCSDHGFSTVKSEVYLNTWLMDEGYLNIEDKEKGIQSISDSSKAFCLDPSRIYIHLKGKYPKGCVSDGEYADLRSEIAEKLEAISWNGENVIGEVYFKEDIFRGPLSDSGPDLYALPEYGFNLKGTFNKDSLFGTSHFTGMHTQDDAFLYVSDTALSPSRPHITDIAGIVLTYLTDAA